MRSVIIIAAKIITPIIDTTMPCLKQFHSGSRHIHIPKPKMMRRCVNVLMIKVIFGKFPVDYLEPVINVITV